MAEPARPYTPDTLAERWSCSPQHIRDLIAQGKLGAFRIGRMLRIPRDEVERIEASGLMSEERKEPSLRNPAPRVIGRPR